MSVRAVLFDIGNVLLHWQPEAFFDRVVGAERRAAFFEAVPILAMNDRVDAGAVLAQEAATLAEQHPDWSKEIALWTDRYLEMIGPAIDGSVDLLRALRRADVAVFALSNFGNESFAQAEREYPFLEEFDVRYISAQLGVAKPDAAIFAHVETDCGLPPGALLFTDDRADNIAAAKARGWKTHLFEGPEGLAARLVDEGLLASGGAA